MTEEEGKDGRCCFHHPEMYAEPLRNRVATLPYTSIEAEECENKACHGAANSSKQPIVPALKHIHFSVSQGHSLVN